MVRADMLLLACACTLSACGRSDPVPDLRTQVDTIGGTIFTESAVVPAGFADLRTRIGTPGSANATGPAVFGRISSVTMSRDGVIYVADGQANEVRTFSVEGRHLGTFGREGEGPGEFGALYSLGWLGDTLAVLDPGNARISLHDGGGTYVGQRSWLPYTGPSSRIRLFTFRPDELYTPYPSFDRQNPSHIFLRFRGGTVRPDTLRHPEVQTGPRGTLCRHPSGGISFFANPFAPTEIVVPGPGGTIASAQTAETGVVYWNTSSDSARVVTVREPAAPLSDDAWNTVAEEYAAYRAENSGTECEPEALARPSHMPAARGLFFTASGALVIERQSISMTRFDFFDASGVLEQRIDLPLRDPSVAPVFADRWILVVEKDGLDVQSVVLYER